MKKFISIACTLLVMSIASTGAIGEPGYNYQSAGTIDRVDLRAGVIVIDDWLYRFSPNLQIRNKRNGIARPSDLRKGKKVGMNTYGSGTDVYIHEIRILPDDFDLERILNEDDG